MNDTNRHGKSCRNKKSSFGKRVVKVGYDKQLRK